MDYKLEVIVLPVTDVERAKTFYVDKLGFHLDADTEPMPNFRVVHMTPPGSGCSVVLGPITYDPADPPATRAQFQLVATDLPAARAELAGRGVETSDVHELSPLDGGSFSYLSDPDGNQWAIQEIRDFVGAQR